MLDTFQIYNELKDSMEAVVAEKIASVIGLVYKELRQSVTKTEFSELKAAVEDLAQAQQRTEAAIKELVQFQQRTEVEMNELRKELAQSQQRTEVEMNELRVAIKDLAQAQQRTEQIQQRTEQRVEKLAIAQEKTEKTMRQLAKQVGGLSETVGGDIEDIAYIVLHDVLKREFGWQVGVLERVWQTWGTEPEEVNILGQATDPAEPDKTLWIVGEAKHNISKTEVKKFIKQLKQARQNLSGEIFPVMFCYRVRPEVQQMIRDANIRLVFSYGKLV